MTTIIPIARRGEDPRLALDLLSDHFRENEDHGVFIPAAECRTVASLLERVAVRLMHLERVEQAAIGRANAEKALEAMASIEPVEIADLASVADGKLLRFRSRQPDRRPS